MICSNKLSRGHVVDINIAWVENDNSKNCNFRILRGILEGFFIRKNFYEAKKCKKRKNATLTN